MKDFVLENTLRVERARLQMTQADLAERVSVSRQAIIAIENGKYVPSTILAMRLAAVFGKKIDDVFTLKEV